MFKAVLSVGDTVALGPLTRVSPAVHPLLLHLVCLMVTVKTMEIPMRIPQSSIHLGCFKLGRVSCLSFQETEQRANKLQKYLLRTLCFQPFKGVFCFFFLQFEICRKGERGTLHFYCIWYFFLNCCDYLFSTCLWLCYLGNFTCKN